ncbi:MAG: ABC transporter substrate-binding protein [Deltaproteobacteria bacterium]|nr:ABC transporter substrate-binding protein [Deltaproteobacteria bacterium]
MRPGSKSVGFLLPVVLIGWLDAAPVWASAPADNVRLPVTKLMRLFFDSEPGTMPRSKEKEEEFRHALDAAFDFPEMARRSLGTHWQRYADRREEFSAALADFVLRALKAGVGSVRHEGVVYLRERVDDDFSRMDTKLVLRQGWTFPVSYHLRFHQGSWKIYDVLIFNVSLLNYYRSQFDRILDEWSFDELLRSLRERRGEGAPWSIAEPGPKLFILLLAAELHARTVR